MDCYPSRPSNGGALRHWTRTPLPASPAMALQVEPSRANHRSAHNSASDRRGRLRGSVRRARPGGCSPRVRRRLEGLMRGTAPGACDRFGGGPVLPGHPHRLQGIPLSSDILLVCRDRAYPTRNARHDRPHGERTVSVPDRADFRAGLTRQAFCLQRPRADTNPGVRWRNPQRHLRVPRDLHNRQRRHSALGMLTPVSSSTGIDQRRRHESSRPTPPNPGRPEPPWIPGQFTGWS